MEDRDVLASPAELPAPPGCAQGPRAEAVGPTKHGGERGSSAPGFKGGSDEHVGGGPECRARRYPQVHGSGTGYSVGRSFWRSMRTPAGVRHRRFLAIPATSPPVSREMFFSSWLIRRTACWSLAIDV